MLAGAHSDDAMKEYDEGLDGRVIQRTMKVWKYY